MSALAATLRAARGISHKADLRALLPGLLGGADMRIGDDCAAIPDGDGYLLLAIEGFVEDFVKAILDGSPLACPGREAIQTDWVTARVMAGAC